MFSFKSKDDFIVDKHANLSFLPKSKTSPNLRDLQQHPPISPDICSPILNIYLGLPSPIGKKYDPLERETVFLTYIQEHGNKKTSANWQGHLITKPILKRTKKVEESLQLFTLILKYEKGLSPYEKPSICSYILEVVKNDQELSDELCCLLVKQLRNNNSGFLNLSWALFALLFPYLNISENIRHMIITLCNKAAPSQFEDLVNEVRLRAVRKIRKRTHRPCTVEITKYEVDYFLFRNRKPNLPCHSILIANFLG